MKLDWKKAGLFTWIAIVLMATFTLTACSDDKDKDDEPNVPNLEGNVSVVGVWRHDFSSGYQLMTLGRNGSFSLVEFDYESEDYSDSGTYSVKNNIMTVEVGDEEGIYTILSLTRNKMVLRFEDSRIIRYNNSREGYDEDIEVWTRVE